MPGWGEAGSTQEADGESDRAGSAWSLGRNIGAGGRMTLRCSCLVIIKKKCLQGSIGGLAEGAQERAAWLHRCRHAGSNRWMRTESSMM